MRRQFNAGDHGSFNGIEWNLVVGKKEARLVGGQDLRLDIRTPGGEWRAVPMPLGFLMADVFFQVKETLYPQAQGFEGGNLYMRFLRHSIQHGWEAAKDELELQRRRKAA
jgi:hypothetical protein